MKKIVLAAILPTLLIFSAVVSAQQSNSDNQQEVKTVPNVDLKRYSGKWFEFARYPNKFQKKCVGNTTANYTIQADGKIEVLNKCLEKTGKFDDAIGEAKVIDKTSNAKLKVRFAPSILSFIPNVWGDYWIIDLDSDYQFAAVGDPKRKYLWILSRSPKLDDATYQNILRRVEKMGFNPGKLVKTPQDVEVLKGTVIEKQ